MAISKEHGKWKKDHLRWLADSKRWRTDHKKVASALRNLEQLIKRKENELKVFEKNAKATLTMIKKKPHSPTLHKKLKKAHTVQNRNHTIGERARNGLLKVTKAIENTLRRID